MRGGLAVLALVATLVVAPPPGASALVFTEPARDGVGDDSPERVVLRFDEAVGTAPGSIALHDGNGKRMNEGEMMRPRPWHVQSGIDRRLERARYKVAWRVISVNSGPIDGAWVLHVDPPRSSRGCDTRRRCSSGWSGMASLGASPPV